MKPPPGSLCPRMKITNASTLSTGTSARHSMRMGIEFTSGSVNGAGWVPFRKGCRGIDPTTAAITTPAIPSTESSPMVSSARNSTRIVFTTFAPPEMPGASRRYHIAISGRSCLPSSAHTPKKVATPAAMAIIPARALRGLDVRWNNSGCCRSTNMMITTTSNSTRNCVSATSGAPSIRICNVTPTPVVPSITAAVRRECVVMSVTTDTTTIASGSRSMGRSMPSTRGCMGTPSTPGNMVVPAASSTIMRIG